MYAKHAWSLTSAASSRAGHVCSLGSDWSGTAHGNLHEKKHLLRFAEFSWNPLSVSCRKRLHRLLSQTVLSPSRQSRAKNLHMRCSVQIIPPFYVYFYFFRRDLPGEGFTVLSPISQPILLMPNCLRGKKMFCCPFTVSLA